MMISTKRLLATIVATGIIASQAAAYDFVTGGVYYNILSNTSTRKTLAVTYATTTPDQSGYITTYKGDVVIPAEVMHELQTFKVTQIGDLAMFNNQSVYSLTLPEGISSIGRQAFSHCYSMQTVNIPSTVSRIADYAFEFCEDLTSIALPKTLGDLGSAVFQQCFGLEEITVDPDNEEYVSEEGVLYSGKISSSGRYLVAYPGGKRATSFAIPDDVRAIDSYAFSANRFLKTLTLGESLKTIPPLSFSECESMEYYDVAEGNQYFASDGGVLLTADSATLVQYPIARQVSDYTVPEGVTTLGSASFNQAYYLTDITLPSTLTDVDELSFYLVTGLKNVTCTATRPPSYHVNPYYPGIGLFDTSVYRNATLWVPAEAVSAYKADSQWGQFAKIMAIGSGAVDTVEANGEETTATYYDINGRQLTTPARGSVTIIKRGPLTDKIIVR